MLLKYIRLRARASLRGYSGDDQPASRMRTEAQREGFPVMIKPVSGGSGRPRQL